MIDLNFTSGPKDQIDESLTRLICCLIDNDLDQTYYANSWLQIFYEASDDSFTPQSSESDHGNFKEILQNKYNKNTYIHRTNPDVLLNELLRAICIFEPLILIELNIEKCDDGAGYKDGYYTEDAYTVKCFMEKEINKFKRFIEKAGLIDQFNKYIYSLSFSGLKTCLPKQQIPRAKYALLIMILSCLPNDQIISSLNKCIKILTGIKIKKPTKKFIHTLCCIIYGLLVKHAKNNTQKGKAHCRNLTVQIVTAISPKNEKGEPYFKINKRGVEVALTGK